MKTTSLTRFAPALAIIAMVVMGSPANAAWNLNLNSACTSNSSSVVTGCSDSASGLTAVGGSTTWNPTNSSSVTFSAATVKEWTGGLGVTSDGNHSIDNYKGTDAILLSFSAAVNLTSVTLGWTSNDSDFSLLAYTTSGDAVVNGRTLASGATSLLGNGWTLIGNYADAPVSPASVDVSKASPTYSSYWLVSAYNSYFGSTSSNGGSLVTKSDYFKLLSVAGNTKPTDEVSEPAALLLFGTALLGMLGLRRRRPTEN
jgi:hypothetical protein